MPDGEYVGIVAGTEAIKFGDYVIYDMFGDTKGITKADYKTTNTQICIALCDAEVGEYCRCANHGIHYVDPSYNVNISFLKNGYSIYAKGISKNYIMIGERVSSPPILLTDSVYPNNTNTLSITLLYYPWLFLLLQPKNGQYILISPYGMHSSTNKTIQQKYVINNTVKTMDILYTPPENVNYAIPQYEVTITFSSNNPDFISVFNSGSTMKYVALCCNNAPYRFT